MDFAPLVEKRRSRLSELEAAMGEPDFFDDQRKATEMTREHTRIKELLSMWDEQTEVQKQIAENRELLSEDDPEIVEMAEMEIPELEKRLEQLESNIQYSLLPRDPTEDRDAIFEIRAGTGGDEASLFAGDLLRMYQRHAETRGWKFETLESAPSDVGGFKEVTVKISGEEVFRYLKYESGVHRVQRVPNTETQGRIHTSTATVAVMPEAEDVDVQLKPEDLRIEVCRAGGAGGQHVNRTESAVQVFHLPTGVMVRCEDGRSQTKNKEKALMILRSKLLERQQQEQAAEYSEKRRNLIGSGGREEKIRTYNFPQNRITDHRIGLTVYNLDQVLEGQINELTENLQAAEIADRLEELEANA
ncbi:peptide chain release factor 1 [Sulfuriroseicoccus oceanibius]|uniref:Peptide chain release factor 1 n=1 Tax=Sulfuriroseicoccus oceanibius TaxID=2707525 RepID=A0A6B3L4R2_9BACT|nr:peptide chain release factor 1 [Sulfuriroseicoccus oceanibius]QQL44004.1 peptide chain release factor 1 [Sulfuriroseicoccus oceanibius]